MLTDWLQTTFRRALPVRPRRRRPLSLRRAVEQCEARCLMSATANLVAYRPVTQYIDSSQYPISEADEADAKRGAGIRVNGDDDNANGIRDFLDTSPLTSADDDLIRVDVNGTGTSFTLNWTGSLAVWTSATKSASVVNGASVQTGTTLWVEYTSDTHTVATSTQLTLTASDGVEPATDSVVFHSFRSVVVSIAGFSQSPTNFGDPNLGTYNIAAALYSQGYDVALFAHGDVLTTGQGAAYQFITTAVLKRNVDQVAIIGYSWGGGATYDLSSALSKNKQLKPAGYQLAYVGFIDAVRHNQIKSETRKPVGAAYVDNFYQQKEALGGAKISKTNSVNVTTTVWGASLVHTTIDDSPTLQALIIQNLTARIA